MRRSLSALTAFIVIAAGVSVAGASAHAAPALHVTGAGGTPSAGAQAAINSHAAIARVAVPGGYGATGIDVSSAQGNVDWAKVAATGVRFAYVKATEGSATNPYVNPNFTEQYGGAKAAGIYAGAYAFGRPDSNDPAAQADYLFANAAYSATDGKTLPLMLDIEGPYPGSNGTSPCWGLSRQAMLTWIQSFMTELQTKSGRAGLLYSSAGFWNACTGGATAPPGALLNVACWCPAPPTLPSGWASYIFWQYTDAQIVNGVTGNVDGIVFHGSASALAALAASQVPGWSASESLANGLASGPAAASWSSGRLDVFWINSAGHLAHSWYGGAGWQGPEDLGGQLSGGVTAASWAPGRLDVFAQGSDGSLQHEFYDGIRWHGFEGLATGLASPPAVTSWAAGRLDLFWLNSAGHLTHIWYAARWLGPEDLGGQLTTGVGATSWAPLRLDVFSTTSTGNLQHTFYDGTRWHGFEALTAGVSSAPTVTAWSAGRLDAFWVNTGGHLAHYWYGSSKWSGPEDLAGPLATGVGAVSWAVGRLDVFSRASDGTLQHLFYPMG